MRRAAELQQLARLARQQALLTTNRETSQVLLEIERQYSNAANARVSAMDDERSSSRDTQQSE